MPAGEAVFAWTWMNREQEFFMDCAAVTITKGGSSLSSSSGSSSGGSKKGTDSALSAATASNAAPAYYMDDSCSCICASPFKVDKDDQYVTGGCTCTCDKLPSTAKPEMIHKHETASQPVAKRMTTAIAMGGAECSCTCAQAAHKESNGEYSMEDCTCTCSKNPASATKKIKTKRFGSFAHGLSDAHFHRLIAKGNVERDVEIIHNEFDDRSVAYENRPSMFFADINDGCESPHTTAELKYPNPGPNVVPGDGAYPLALPSGNCGN